MTARRFDQAKVAFVNQVQQRHAQPAEPLRVAHDQAQVRLDEAAERDLITVALNETTELTLIVAG